MRMSAPAKMLLRSLYRTAHSPGRFESGARENERILIALFGENYSPPPEGT
jgi:hypothetical protein